MLSPGFHATVSRSVGLWNAEIFDREEKKEPSDGSETNSTTSSDDGDRQKAKSRKYEGARHALGFTVDVVEGVERHMSFLSENLQQLTV